MAYELDNILADLRGTINDLRAYSAKQADRVNDAKIDIASIREITLARIKLAFQLVRDLILQHFTDVKTINQRVAPVKAELKRATRIAKRFEDLVA